MFLHYAAPSIRRKIINSKKAFLAVFQKPLEWPEPGKPMADALKSRVGSGVVALVAVNDGKASLVVGVTDDLTGRISAIDLVRAGSAALGGKGGGGRPDMAQAGGPDGAAAEAAMTAIEEQLAAL